jgi:acyl-CoA thioesterase FadM
LTVPRSVEFDVTTDTRTFSAVQLQPGVIAATTWNALARWLRAYLVPFPSLIADEHVGLVVLGFHLTYHDPASFFECPVLTVRGALRILRRGERGQFDIRFVCKDRVLARAHLILCPVAIRDPITLGAEPAPLPERILDRLEAEEIEAGSPDRPVPERLVAVETRGIALAEGKYPFTIHRHSSEAAEQWSWTEVPALCEAARESLALGNQSESRATIRRCLGVPMMRFDVEFGRPFFSFESGSIVSRVFALSNRLGIVHRFTSGEGAALHATVVEVF